MKKIYIWFAVLAIGLTTATSIGTNVSVAKTSADFSDLKDLDAATKAKFDAMISTGIFVGTSADNFGVEDNMTRAQFAKVAALIFGLEVDKSLKTSSFSDVKADDPGNGFALPYIEVVKAAGITDGVGNGMFDPSGEVTKEQLATFLIRGLGMKEDAESTPPTSDSTVSSWAAGYVGLALELGLLENSSDGTFGGKEEASRELLVTGGFETAKTFEETKPLEVSGADFAAGNKLHLTLTVSIDGTSVDLSKITINGVALDPKLDSYELSEDKKTIIIKLHEGFWLDSSKTPVIAVNGLKTVFGNEVKNDESKVIPVSVTVAPVNTPTPTTKPVVQQPTPTPTATPVVQQPTPTPTATPVVQQPTPTPTATPVVQQPTPTPTATPVVQQPTPTPTQQIINPNE